MKDSKNFYIAFIILMCVVYGFIWLFDYNSSTQEIEAIKAGLEQCPQDPTTHYVQNRTIWVKSCAEYMKTYNGLK